MDQKVGLRFVLRAFVSMPRAQVSHWRRNPRLELRFWGIVLPLLAATGVLVGRMAGSVLVGMLAPCGVWLVGVAGGAAIAVRDINRGR